MRPSRQRRAVTLVAGVLAACTQPGPVIPDRDPVPGSRIEPSPQAGTSMTGDAGVRRALDELGLTYAVDPDGDFELVFRFSNGRQQRVYVWSQTSGFEGFRVREIRSYAFDLTETRAGDQVLQTLLADTLERELGGWAVDGPFAVFVTRIPADSSNEVLHVAMEYAAFVADEMERGVYGGIRDRF